MRRLVSAFLTALLLGTFSCADYNTVATVDSEKITLKEFSEICERKAGLLGVEALTPEDKKDVLDSMIQREIAYLYAKEMGIKVSDEVFKEAAKDLSFIDRLRHRKAIEKNLLFEEIKRRVTRYIRASEEEIKGYYESHKEEFSVPETYKVYLVRLKESDLSHVLRKVKENTEVFDDMALQRVSEELREINKKASFTPKDGFPEVIWPYLKRMKTGDIAGPVKVKRGTFIFKLVDKRPSSLKTFTDAYFEIEHLVTSRKSEEAFQKWYDRIKDRFKVEVKIKEMSSITLSQVYP